MNKSWDRNRLGLSGKQSRTAQVSRKIGAVFLGLMLGTGVAAANAYDFSYSGRIVDEKSGKPQDGPVALKVNFYRQASGGTPILSVTNGLGAVPLQEGVFQISVSLSQADYHQVFSAVDQPVYVEITNVTLNEAYGRQLVSMIPYAAKIPINDKTLTYDGDGKLTLSFATQPASNQFMTIDSNGRLAWGTPSVAGIQGREVASTAPVAGQALVYDGSQWKPQTLSSGSVSSVNLANQVTGTLPLLNGGTGATSNSAARSNLGAAASGANSDITSLSGLSTALSIGQGGTGLSATPANGQLIIGNSTGYTLAGLSQGTNAGVTVANGVGSITLDTAQDIRTSATPTFAGMVVGSGNVGIGTTAPAQKLHVSSGYTIANDQASTTNTNFGVLLFPDRNFGLDLGYSNSSAWATRVFTRHNADIVFSKTTQDYPTLQSHFTDLVTIKNNGNVGIGITNPGSKFEVKVVDGERIGVYGGTGLASETSYLAAQGRSRFGYDGARGAVVVSDHTATKPIVFDTSSVERMRITAGGAVGIATNNPSYTLHVVGTAGLSTGTAWTNASDKRLKDVEGDYEFGLNEIKKLHTIRFRYKKDNALNLPSDHKMTGFIAQEVRNVIPDAVKEGKDGYLELNVDPIHWAAINAIKELAAENTELKAKNRNIQAQLDGVIKFLCDKDPEAAMCLNQ